MRALVDHCGAAGKGVQALADRLNKTLGQTSNFAGDNPTKGIGPKIAREIEQAFGAPSGWLDAPVTAEEVEYLVTHGTFDGYEHMGVSEIAQPYTRSPAQGNSQSTVTNFKTTSKNELIGDILSSIEDLYLCGKLTDEDLLTIDTLKSALSKKNM